RYFIEEYPMPKSSSTIDTPRFLSSCKTARFSSFFSSSTVSVISSSSRLGASAQSARVDMSAARRSPCLNCVGDRLTASFRCDGPGPAQDPFAKRNDQAALFRQADELIGRNQPALRMAPTHQRLGAAHLVASGVDDGLVVELELAACERLAHVLFELTAVA